MKSDIPVSVNFYLASISCALLAPGYVCLDDSHRLITWGGPLDKYGLLDLRSGVPAVEKLPFLDGLLPCSDTPVVVAQMQLIPERYIDLHLFANEHGQWIIFLDSTAFARHTQERQQIRFSKILENEKNK